MQPLLARVVLHPACRIVRHDAALETHVDSCNANSVSCRTISATFPFAGATHSDTRITVISLRHISDPSACSNIGSPGTSASSDPRVLDGNTSSIRLITAVESSRDTSTSGLDVLIACYRRFSRLSWATSTLAGDAWPLPQLLRPMISPLLARVIAHHSHSDALSAFLAMRSRHLVSRRCHTASFAILGESTL